MGKGSKTVLKVPKNIVASIILKWKKFGTTKTVPRAGRWKPLLSKRHITVHLEFAKRHLKDSQTMRNEIIWSVETKIELFGLNAKRHVWSKPKTIPTVKHWWEHHAVGMFFRGRDWETR